MIAKPLVWETWCDDTKCQRYHVRSSGGRWPKFSAYAYDYNKAWASTYIDLGRSFKTQTEAQAACERHHQVAAAKMLTPWARSMLVMSARVMSDPAFFVVTDSIAEADRAEQEGKQ